VDLYAAAKERLKELPKDNSWEQLIRPSFRGLFTHK
jgi:hypothetical protein